MAGIESDDGSGMRVSGEEVRRDPRGSARDGDAVHAIRTRAHAPAQARGAEGEGPAEGIVDLGTSRGITYGCGVDESLQLRPRVGVGVVGEPLLRTRH
jgi:hypothetical protein